MEAHTYRVQAGLIGGRRAGWRILFLVEPRREFAVAMALEDQRSQQEPCAVKGMRELPTFFGRNASEGQLQLKVAVILERLVLCARRPD